MQKCDPNLNVTDPPLCLIIRVEQEAGWKAQDEEENPQRKKWPEQVQKGPDQVQKWLEQVQKWPEQVQKWPEQVPCISDRRGQVHKWPVQMWPVQIQTN